MYKIYGLTMLTALAIASSLYSEGQPNTQTGPRANAARQPQPDQLIADSKPTLYDRQQIDQRQMYNQGSNQVAYYYNQSPGQQGGSYYYNQNPQPGSPNQTPGAGGSYYYSQTPGGTDNDYYNPAPNEGTVGSYGNYQPQGGGNYYNQNPQVVGTQSNYYYNPYTRSYQPNSTRGESWSTYITPD